MLPSSFISYFISCNYFCFFNFCGAAISALWTIISFCINVVCSFTQVRSSLRTLQGLIMLFIFLQLFHSLSLWFLITLFCIKPNILTNVNKVVWLQLPRIICVLKIVLGFLRLTIAGTTRILIILEFMFTVAQWIFFCTSSSTPALFGLCFMLRDRLSTFPSVFTIPCVIVLWNRKLETLTD